jgi:hypothetical protein
VLSDNLVSQIESTHGQYNASDWPARVIDMVRRFKGGNEMRRLAKMGMVAVICLGATVSAEAGARPGPQGPRAGAPGPEGPRPIAGVKLPKGPLYFRVTPARGPRVLQAKTTVRVLANHPFRLDASFGGLSQPAGQAAIPPRQMAVTINGKNVPIGTERVPIALGGPTPGDGVEVPIVIEVTLKGSAFFPAGRYGGNLVLSVI